MRHCMTVCVLVVASSVVTQADDAPPAPPIPPGYETPNDAKAAVLDGRVPMANVFAPVPQHIQVLTHVEYGRVGDKSLQLDLYQPRDMQRPAPGLIMIHGGGWRGGNRRIMHTYCVLMAERGYVVATISYRLTGEAPYPAAVQDAKCAVRWMRANAKKYHVDPERIAALGGSAGGHLAMMLGYSADMAHLEGDGGHPGVSSRVQAVVNFYGPTDLTTDFARSQGMLVSFMGGKRFEQAREQYLEASPLTHLTADDPPTLTLHGTIDSVVPFVQAEMLDRKAAQLNVPHRLVAFPGWPHSMNIAKPVHDRCVWEMNRFLDEHLPLPSD